MKKTSLFLTTCLTAFSLLSLSLPLPATQIPTDVSQKAKPATIKVLLVKQADEIQLEVKGRYQVYNPTNDYLLSSGVLSKRHVVAPTDFGIKWGEVFPSLFQIRIVPGDSQSTILVNGIQYKGCIEIYQINNKINIVNEIDIESYLKSTLTAQFPQEINKDVMDSIAILARTNAYYFVSKNAHSFWHVEAQDANYQGYGITLQNLRVDRSVENTRHAILTYQNAPFATSWTQDCAGKTAAYTSIFRKEAASTQGVEAPYSARDREKHQWSFSLSKAQLAKMAGIHKVSAAKLFLDKDSQKVYALRLSDGTASKDLDYFTLQKAIGPKKLLSNDFSISVKEDSVLFNGYGEGHGVGLCLYSAMQMAERGEATPKILAAFFPNTQLQKVRTLKPTEAIAENEHPNQTKR